MATLAFKIKLWLFDTRMIFKYKKLAIYLVTKFLILAAPTYYIFFVVINSFMLTLELHILNTPIKRFALHL